ncbi:hypothetical protein [Methanobrevibacter sp.]|uniref:hypothetical protein n=1 Tax=Methanobrevibacter sp. TaxID=66852 RepID=UPI00388FC61D
MKKIILSLIFIMIALAGVSCAGASSDFNDTSVENNPDIYESISPICDMENSTEADSINETSEDAENDTVIEDPVDYYSAYYKDFKKEMSQYRYSMPTYDALQMVSGMLIKYYDKASTINLLTDIFCHAEFENPTSITKFIMHTMIESWYDIWYPEPKKDNKKIDPRLRPIFEPDFPHPPGNEKF